jgi:hypothetical protein
LPRSCHEGMWDSGDLSPHISNLNFPSLPFVQSPIFDWICSRMNPRIKQDASQIHRAQEIWSVGTNDPHQTIVCVINLFRVCGSVTRYWFQTLSVIQCWRWRVFCLQLHDSATQHYLKCQNPKITPSVTLSRIISTGTWDFRFSYVWTEVLLILWCRLPNFMSIKKRHKKLH